MSRCGVCFFWEHESDDVDSNGAESEYGRCDGPVPASVCSPLKVRMNFLGGENCRAFVLPARISWRGDAERPTTP
jgi:hypothetical protein